MLVLVLFDIYECPAEISLLSKQDQFVSQAMVWLTKYAQGSWGSFVVKVCACHDEILRQS